MMYKQNRANDNISVFYASQSAFTNAYNKGIITDLKYSCVDITVSNRSSNCVGTREGY